MHLSILDLCPVVAGQPAASALHEALELARFAERLGFKRYWVAEHHSMAGIASSSPEVIIGHLAQATERIRVGSGGVMLPNHAPLRIAEAFRTLEAFHPGRIDLGIGRAPGTNRATTAALRGATGLSQSDDFPQAFAALQAYLSGDFVKNSPYEDVVAMPTVSGAPEIWMLGSSDSGARMAAALGLRYVFAQHFSPLPAAAVLQLYRDQFRASGEIAHPEAMVAVHMICGETDEEARRLAAPSDIAFYRYRTTGRSSALPTLQQAAAEPLTPAERARLRTMSFPKFVGSPETLRPQLASFLAETKVQELLVLTMIPDAEARRQSYRRLAEMAPGLA